MTNALIDAIRKKDINAVQMYFNDEGELGYADTALRLAEDRDQHEIVALLLGKGATIDQVYFSQYNRHGLTKRTVKRIIGFALLLASFTLLLSGSLLFSLLSFSIFTVVGATFFAAYLYYDKRVISYNPVHSVNRFDLNECFNHVDLQRLAVVANVNARDKDGKTALMYAVHSKNIERVKQLLADKPDIYAKDRYGRTALMYAVSNGDIEMAKVLIENDAGINARNNYDDTALMIAAYKGYTDMVMLLLENEAKPDPVTGSRYGETALLLAVSGGHLNTVEALLEKGARVDIANRHGKTPLMIAKHKGYGDIVKLLTEYKERREPNKLLMIAAYTGCKQMVQHLLDRGADINAMNNHSHTALMIAEHKKDDEIVKLFTENPVTQLT